VVGEICGTAVRQRSTGTRSVTKISVMHITYDMRIGGTEMVIKNLIEGSDPDLFDMSIFCVEEPLGPWGKDLQKNGIEITSKARQPGFDTSLIFAIRQHIKENKIDIIHCHQYTPWVYGVLAAFGTKTKVIFTEHGRFHPDSSSWKRKLINPWLSRITDSITSISKATKLALVEFENIPKDKIKVIYNGIRKPKVEENKVAELRHKLGISATTKVLGTIARLDPIKNHKMMLEAFALVLQKHPDTILIIVGDGEERENIENKVKLLGIEQNVILPGYNPQPQHYLALMDVFLLSSLSEGTSMTLLEAMSLGKPCVVTDAGGNAEIVSDMSTGYVTCNDDSQLFYKAISKLMTDRTCSMKYGKNAEQKFKEAFSDILLIQNYTEIYNSK
jgi:glycosyltransferase involved in cell wall biosynthesis